MRVSMHRRGVSGVCNPEGSTPGNPLWTWSAFFDIFCTPATTANAVTSISTSDPNSPMNPNACYGGGALLDQSACLSANATAASNVAASNQAGASAYNCSQSPSPFLCYLGITDANGDPTSNGLITLLSFGVGAAVLFSMVKK
jgi:hypothetical protein